VNYINEVLQSTAQALGQSLASVFADLERLAEATTQILAAPGTSRTKLESLRPVVEDIVLKQAGLVDSAGYPSPRGCSPTPTRGTNGGASWAGS
jgi:3-methyladenine DNA glycosylase/8-oxoguanine DNA glycosylase